MIIATMVKLEKDNIVTDEDMMIMIAMMVK
jgi:hypothetical protein